MSLDMDNDAFGAALAVEKARARRGEKKEPWGAYLLATAFVLGACITVLIFALG